VPIESSPNEPGFSRYGPRLWISFRNNPRSTFSDRMGRISEICIFSFISLKSLAGRGFCEMSPRKIQMSKNLDIKILRIKSLGAPISSLPTVTCLDDDYAIEIEGQGWMSH
jgi:hypothetical protein